MQASYPFIPTTQLNQDALVDRMIRQLDRLNWEIAGQSDDVRVYATTEIDCPYDGFLTVTEHVASLEEITAFLGRNICETMEAMNHRYLNGEVFDVFHDRGDMDYYALVRTSFKMPFPMSDREFPHSLYVTTRGDDRAFIVYHSVCDRELPPVQPGFVRCPTYLSGQRISALPSGETRVEHMMVYGLAGQITPWIQNRLFRKGHVKAYLGEWQALVDRYRS